MCKDSNAKPDVYKSVSVRVPVKVWENFRIRAFEERTSMQKIASNLISTYLDQEKF